MFVADAAVVGDEGIGAVGSNSQDAHQEFRLLIDTAGGNGYHLDAFLGGQQDLILYGLDHIILMVRRGVQNEKQQAGAGVLPPGLPSDGLLEGGVHRLGEIPATVGFLNVDKIHHLREVPVQVGGAGDVFVAFIAIKNRTHAKADVIIVIPYARDNIVDLHFDVFQFVCHGAGGVKDEKDVGLLAVGAIHRDHHFIDTGFVEFHLIEIIRLPLNVHFDAGRLSGGRPHQRRKEFRTPEVVGTSPPQNLFIYSQQNGLCINHRTAVGLA